MSFPRALLAVLSSLVLPGLLSAAIPRPSIHFIVSENSDPELGCYDLRTDPYEYRDLRDAPAHAAELARALPKGDTPSRSGKRKS